MLPLDEIKVLMGLGLTSCQTRVYLALCHCGNLDVKTVSKCANVPRQDIYRIAEDLKKLGLIETVISRPISFQALPLNNGTSILLKRRKLETKKLESKTNTILKNFKTNNKYLQIEEPEFVLIPGNDAVVERMKEAVEKAENSIDVVSTWKMFSHILSFAYVLEKAWSREVKCRFVTENPPKGGNPEAVLKFYRKTPFCEVRFVLSPPKTVLSIYDRKDVMLIVDPKMGLTKSPALWSNNPGLLAAMQDYYEVLWITALEKPQYTPSKGKPRIQKNPKNPLR